MVDLGGDGVARVAGIAFEVQMAEWNETHNRDNNHSHSNGCPWVRSKGFVMDKKHLRGLIRSSTIAENRSSSWKPNTNQKKYLQSSHISGTGSPTSLEIKNITTQLQRYGWAEEEEVASWFENNKSKDKMKNTKLQIKAFHWCSRKWGSVFSLKGSSSKGSSSKSPIEAFQKLDQVLSDSALKFHQ